jgi:hypothetical protein
MTTPTRTPTDETRLPSGFQVRAEAQELTLEHLAAGATVFDLPILGFGSKLVDAMKEIYQVSWEYWPPTIWVSQILVNSTPAAGANPPQNVTTTVSVFGLGFRPGVPVNLKWNNAIGFPGATVPLPDATPDSHGRFGLVLHHTTVTKAAKDWYWEYMNQLVLVAQQHRPDGSIEFDDDFRGVPGHVLWKWIP